MTTQNVKSDISDVLPDISEADHDFNTPFLVIIVLCEAYFSNQTESCQFTTNISENETTG